MALGETECPVLFKEQGLINKGNLRIAAKDYKIPSREFGPHQSTVRQIVYSYSSKDHSKN